MHWPDRVSDLLPTITGDPRRDQEIRDELAQHCAERHRDLIAGGMPPATATATVLQELRDTAAARAPLARAVVAESSPGFGARIARAAEQWRHDLRGATRRLRHAPAFTGAALLTLAVAIGATTAVASVVRGVLVRPLPYPNPASLAFIWETSPTGSLRNVVSSGNYLDWRARQTSFSSMGVLQNPGFQAWTGGNAPRRVRVAYYSADALQTLRPTPVVGRLFHDADAVPDAPRAALLGFGFWTREFAADADVVGRSIMLDGRPYDVVGVLPADTVLPDAQTDVVVPLRLAADAANSRRSHNFTVIGRLRDGVSIDAAGAEMQAIAGALAVEHPADMTGWGTRVVGIRDDLVRDVRPLMVALAGVVLVVLLVACANLANLQLARVSARQGDLAIEAALGASRARIVRQLLVESGLLAAAGGALGIGLAALLQPAIVAFMPADIPRLDAVAIDAGVLALAVAATITSAIVVGLLPALQFGRLDLRPVMHGTRVRSDAGQGRIRHLLVAAQVALALVLLVSAALLVKSFYRLQAVDAGFDPARLLTVQLDLPGARYPDNAAHRRFYDDLLARLQATPGIAVAAGTTAAPGEGSGMTFSYAIDGRPSSTPTGREAPLPLQAVTAGYFDVMGIAVVAGRGIESGDREDAAPVVVINEALARQHWSDRSPLGRRLSFRPGQTPWLEIVGVVANTRDEGRAEEAPPTLYVPFAQKPPTWTWMTWQTLVVRAGIDRPETLRPAIEAAVWSLDPDLPLLEVRTMDAAMAEPEARRRFATQLFGAFALIAVLLGAVGVYGVMAYGVAQRRQEIGIRLMLGARPAQVVVAVSKAALLFAGAGLAAGVVAAAGATRLLESLLYDVAPTDVATFASMALALFAVAGLAAWIPARRALQLDPVVVLRDS